METGERALPEDIRKLAYELAYEGSMPPLAASAERIAAALLAERERAMKARVKLLEWEEARVSDRWQRFTASTILGNYEALEWSDGSFGGSIPSRDRDETNVEFTSASIEEAKATAQADFERRIAEAIRA